jgi:serine protease DegS
LKKVLQFITWPALAGLLAAILILQWLSSTLPGNTPTTAGATSFATAVERAAPSVVNIWTSTRVTETRRHPIFEDPVFRRFFGRERVQQSLGSGVIVSSQGYILTNRHVIASADTILVLLHDGREALAAVVGSDADTDLAVLKIQLEDVIPIELGDPDTARVGDIVLAIGNPYGFGHSVSQGIVSALGRYGLNLSVYENFIQTDAAINQGNSGGALIDSEGRLLGINTAIFTQRGAPTAIGLATPSDLAMDVMNDLVSYGKVIRGWLGLEAQPVSLASGSGSQMLRVSAVSPGGPADKAGIRPGDVITHIDEDAVIDGRQTMTDIASRRPGDAVNLTLQRQASRLEMSVIVGVRPQTAINQDR